MVFLYVIIVVSLIFAIIGYIFSNKIYDDRGIYPIGGPNGGKASKYLRNHPEVQAVYDQIERGGFSEENIQQLLQRGAKAVITPLISNSMLVLMEEAAIAFGDTGNISYGAKGQLCVPMSRCEGCLRKEEIEVKVETGREVTKNKGKSVIGSAIVGSVVAGGVGAVVGAISAANHNTNNKEITTIKYETKGTGIDITYFKFEDGSGKIYLNNIYVTDDISISESSIYGAVRSVIRIIEEKDYGKATSAINEKVEEPKESELQVEEPKESELQQEIIDFLAEHPQSTLTVIKEGCPSLRNGTKAEVARLVRTLLFQGEIVRTEDKEFAYFSLK